MSNNQKPAPNSWKGWGLFSAAMVVTFVLGMLVTSIVERRQEAAMVPQLMTPIPPNTSDSAVWGRNFPREYGTWQQTIEGGTQTKYCGPNKVSYLKNDPRLKILWAGYPFSIEYNQPRGHMHALEDVRSTARRDPKRGGALQPGTCMTCKSPEVPILMSQMGTGKFYQAHFEDINKKVYHPIGCADCHDRKTMNLTITRPALREAFKAMGKDVDKASLQEMRTLVCAQCHAEYYFAKQPGDTKKGTYLTFPWKRGTNIDNIEKYYTDDVKHVDWVHKISGTKMIKMQHPDYEMFQNGIHAQRGVACADCHMPYRSEGGVKFSDHHVQSPLKNVENSCMVCHHWTKEETIQRVYAIQDRQHEMLIRAEDALVSAHEEVGAAMKAGYNDAQLQPARDLIRRAQMRWDYAAANNGMGIHAPQESARVLASAIDFAQQARLKVAFLPKR
ncbi:MAG: ammonia-forming cytochrome c nitrite reductase subunit c552 [Armatimonadota bacterium]